LPNEIPPATQIGQASENELRLLTEEGIEVRLLTPAKGAHAPKRIVLAVGGEDGQVSSELRSEVADGDALYILQPRGTGSLRWTRRDPPNYVERSLALLGQTVDTGRIWDVAATVNFLQTEKKLPVIAAGEGAAGVIAAYAALLTPGVEGCIVVRPTLSHMEQGAPQLLSVIRVCDVQDVLGMLAPRKLKVTGAPREPAKTAAIYKAAGASDALTIAPPAEK
jgi:hypothetical protein